MKKAFAIILCLCMAVYFVACGQPLEEEQATHKQAYADFKADWNKQNIIAINARVITDANGDKMLMADIKNNSYYDISTIVLSFAAWDAEGNFVTIKSKNHPTNTIPEFQMDITDVTIASGETWVADAGIFLAEECPDIVYVEAAVASCKMGESDYINNLYETWKEIYLQQPLENWMKAETD